MSTETTTPTTTAPAIRLMSVDFDCPDPAGLARFYGEALGLPVVHSSDDFVLLGREGEPGLGFIRDAHYTPPTWPDPARGKQAHMELNVDDLAAARARLLALGATEPATQPHGDPRRRVLLDPAGHPFCIATES
jgi:catechol 2,3-dioxygenase-like lactoylglutathione lyase family enzyme